MDVVLNPGEGDGPLSAALAEPQQEGSGTLVAQQSLLSLLTDEAHDGAAHRGREHSYLCSGAIATARTVTHPSFQRDSRCLLITSRIPSIHNQKGKDFSLALCCRANGKKNQLFSSAKTWICFAGRQRLTLQNLFQGINPSGFLWALAPAEKHHRHQPLKTDRSGFSLFVSPLVPSSLSASMLSCSWFRPRLVMEENCQLRTSDSWDHFACGGVRKNFRF